MDWFILMVRKDNFFDKFGRFYGNLYSVYNMLYFEYFNFVKLLNFVVINWILLIWLVYIYLFLYFVNILLFFRFFFDKLGVE